MQRKWRVLTDFINYCPVDTKHLFFPNDQKGIKVCKSKELVSDQELELIDVL